MKYHQRKLNVHSCVLGMVHQCSKFVTFLKRAAILVGVLIAVTLFIMATNQEPFSGLSLFKEATIALSEAAADAFGESS